MMRRNAAVLAASAAWLLGCPRTEETSKVTLVAVTPPPPTLIAEVSDRDQAPRIRMTLGVALAVSCWDYCKGQRKQCDGFAVTSSDPEVVTVRDAYRANGTPTAVLAGRKAGSTTVTLSTACGSKSYVASVEHTR